MALANEHNIPVVPQAGNTGLVGGQMAMNGEIVLSVGRLKTVRNVDAQGFTMTVEAGLTLAEAQAAADNVNRLFPLSLPSEGTCQIGGNLGTNAGGVGVLAYGNTRQLVLGLEVVLADGRIWKGLNALKKDNTGYDLKDLFIGSEGTLGIITAAVLKLFPKPAEKATAILALPELANAIALIGIAQETAGQSLTAFEFLPRTVLEMVLRNVRNTRDPFSEVHPWYVLMEISGSKPDGTADRVLTEILEAASEKGLITDARLAASLAQANDFWRLREGVSEAQKPEGGNIKNDVSVPIAKIPEFIARANAAVAARLSRRAAAAARPLRRRQRALQHRPAHRHAEGGVHGAVERHCRRGPRDGAALRRLDLRRARHRPDETRRARQGQGRCRHGPDAQHQGRAGPQGDPQSRQGAVMQGSSSRRRPGPMRLPAFLPAVDLGADLRRHDVNTHD